MSKYPDWVLKHKIKGTHIIKKNGKYYLYKVHSERRPDKSYPVLVTDEYLGVITEEGVISKKQRIKDVVVKEYGLSKYYINLTVKLFPDIDNYSLVSIVLNLAYEKATKETYNSSYISELYPDSFSSHMTLSEFTLLQIKENTDNDLNPEILRRVYKVKINDKWFNSNVSEITINELNKYSIIME